jgi:hypothetical protein
MPLVDYGEVHGELLRLDILLHDDHIAIVDDLGVVRGRERRKDRLGVVVGGGGMLVDGGRQGEGKQESDGCDAHDECEDTGQADGWERVSRPWKGKVRMKKEGRKDGRLRGIARYLLGDGTLTPRRSTDHTQPGVVLIGLPERGTALWRRLITTCGNSITIRQSDVAARFDPVSGAPRYDAQTHLHSTRPVNPHTHDHHHQHQSSSFQPSNSPSLPHLLSPDTPLRGIMGRSRATAIRSGSKPSQPSASASSPTTDIEVTYKQVYDDLDKRKTQKGWQQRKMGWVKGHKVLKELLVSYAHHNHLQGILILPPRLAALSR